MGATISNGMSYNIKLKKPGENHNSKLMQSYSSSKGSSNSSFSVQNLRLVCTNSWTRIHRFTLVNWIVSVVLVVMILFLLLRQNQTFNYNIGEIPDNSLVNYFNCSSNNNSYKEPNFLLDENTWREISSNINVSIDPCDNFYEFSCEGWARKYPRPEYASDWTVFHILTDKTEQMVTEVMETPTQESDIPAYKMAQNFYKSCVQVEEQNEEEDKLVLNFVWDTLEMYGGWPILYENGTWNSTNFNWMKSMTDLSRRFKTTTILDIFSYQDPSTGRMAINNRIVVNSPYSTFGKRKFQGFSTKESNLNFLTSSTTTKNLKKGTTRIIDFILNASNILLRFKGKKKLNENTLRAQVLAMIQMEGELIGLSSQATTTNEQVGYQMTLDQLQNSIDNYLGEEHTLQFREILLLLYEPAYVWIAEQENITVVNVNYLLEILKYVQQADPQTLANVLHYKMLAYVMPLLTNEFRQLIKKSQVTKQGDDARSAAAAAQAPLPRRKICSWDVEEYFRFAVGQKIVTMQYKDMCEFNSLFSQIYHMFNQVKSILIEHRKSLNSFLQDHELKTLIDKTAICVGFPDWLFDSEKVQKYYAELHLEHLTTYVEQTLAANEWVSNSQLRKLRQFKEAEACEWKRFLGEVGGFTETEQYKLYFPLGILQKPFFYQGESLALNYGSMGSVIAHELTHVFAKFGWQQSKQGSLTTKATCLLNQYNNFSLKDLLGEKFASLEKSANVFLNGQLTLDENFADNAGIALAYKAFKAESLKYFNNHERGRPLAENSNMDYSNEQLLFLGFAQHWCEARTINSMKSKMQTDAHGSGFYRVLGTLQNSKEFTQAWHCPVGSKMNSNREKCSLL